MRLIDADALEKEYRRQFESMYRRTRDAVNPSDYYIERRAAYEKKVMQMEMEAFFEYLQSRPTIDAVSVIRCKDCKHLTRSPWNNPDFGWCKLYGHNRKMDYYCASGEVTENE